MPSLPGSATITLSIIEPFSTGNPQYFYSLHNWDVPYIQIPQVKYTYGVILSKPRWMWGAEMGANECGVVIGNEAVWTTESYQSTGLLGMDLVRLGLERGETAFAALQVIVDLLEKYGQGGNCAEYLSFTYHNSFLIADHKEAWILETAGKYWVAKRVIQGTRSISNNLSIRSTGDLRHPDVVRDAVAQGRCKDESDFDFAKLFSDGGVEDPLSPYSREERVRSLCQMHQGEFTVETAKSILRDHQGGICMHVQFETRGSQISRLTAQHNEHWLIVGEASAKHFRPFPCQQEYQRVALPGMVRREHHASHANPSK